MAERYATTSGRSLDQLPWYTVLACFKLGIILEGSHARARSGPGARRDRRPPALNRHRAVRACPLHRERNLMIDFQIPAETAALAERIRAFVTEKIVPFEKDPRLTAHGPTEDLRDELVALAREAGLLTFQAPKRFGGLEPTPSRPSRALRGCRLVDARPGGPELRGSRRGQHVPAVADRRRGAGRGVPPARHRGPPALGVRDDRARRSRLGSRPAHHHRRQGRRRLRHQRPQVAHHRRQRRQDVDHHGRPRRGWRDALPLRRRRRRASSSSARWTRWTATTSRATASSCSTTCGCPRRRCSARRDRPSATPSCASHRLA